MLIPRLRCLLGLYAVRENDPVLAAAQFQALARQILMLYAMVSLNAVGLAYTHYGHAPDWLTLGPPIALLLLLGGRSMAWIRAARRAPQGREAFARLRVVNAFTALIGILASLWAALLFGYGDTAGDMHVIFFLTITMMFCVQCLAHLRSAVHILTTVAVPYCVYYFAVGEPQVQMTIVTYILVLIGSTVMQNFAYRDFRHLVDLTAENGRLALTDTLTGLPNRRSFVARLEELHLRRRVWARHSRIMPGMASALGTRRRRSWWSTARTRCRPAMWLRSSPAPTSKAGAGRASSITI